MSEMKLPEVGVKYTRTTIFVDKDTSQMDQAVGEVICVSTNQYGAHFCRCDIDLMLPSFVNYQDWPVVIRPNGTTWVVYKKLDNDNIINSDEHVRLQDPSVSSLHGGTD